MTTEKHVEIALVAADEARLSGYSYGHGWHVQVLANEVRAMRDEIERLRGTVDRVFGHFGPPQEDCECPICDLQRELGADTRG